MSKIEELYYDYINSERVQDDLEVKKAMVTFEKLLEENNVERKLQNKLLDACVGYGSASERQGFLYGYTLATKIMCEVFCGK